MKKILLFLSFLLMSIGMWSAEVLYKETIFNSSNNSQGISSYSNSWYNTTNGFRMDITNANNNNNGWNYIKFGRKNNASTGTIITNATIDKKITKVGIAIDALTTAKITSITLYTSTNGNSWASRGAFTKSTGIQYNEIYSNNQAENLYYKIEFVCQSGTSNGLITISHLYFYIDDEEPIAPCDSVTISLTPPTNGTASLSKTKVCPDDEIEVTYTPDEGYMLDKILANDVEVENPIIITENTTIQVLFKEIPPEPSIDIARWDTNAVYINIDNFEGLTAVIEGKTGSNVANDLFFSKYFEAGGANKMLGFYNGTKDTLNLKHYTFRLAKINVTPVNLGDYGNYHDSLMLPNTEIIFAHYDESNSAKDCADDQSGYENWIEVPGSGYLYSHMNFGGRGSIGLYKNSVLIDIIGIHDGSVPLQINKPCAYANITGLNDGPGFYTYNGDNIKTETVETDYFLSTNRCMLIRKSTVKDGANAVLKNYHDGVNDECSDTIALQFKTLSEEWIGYQIGNGKNDDALADSTCNGLAYLGHYDYSGYYSSSVDLIDALQEDGTYKLEISQLDTLACNNIKIIAKDNSNNGVETTVKVPIMIAENKNATQVKSKHGASCPSCDLVVMHESTLTVNEALSNRNVKVYEGCRLNIESGKTYTAASLSLRKTNDINPYLTLKGNVSLSGDSSLYLDVYTDPSEWRWLALPEQFDIRTLTLSNGKKEEHRVNYWFKTYDGEYRSINLKNGWASVDDNKVFAPGEGFIFGIAGEGTVKKEYRFKFSNSALTRDKNSKTLSWSTLKAWGCGDNNLKPNHKGWNLIGNPYMDLYGTNIFEPIRIGYLEKEIINDNWTGGWVLSDTVPLNKKLRYRIIYARGTPGEDGNGYSSELLDDKMLEPFTTFFVQLGGDPNTIGSMVLNENKRRSVVSKSLSVDEDDELFLRIFVGDKKTGCFISNKFIDDYEPGDDFESRQSIYQSINGYKLLYSAIPDSTLINGVTVHSNGGKITLDPKVDVNKFEQINVFYNNKWYSLLYGETVDVEAGDFLLQAIRKQLDVPTDIDNVKPSEGLYKFTDGKHIYINQNGYIYNILGTKIK